MSNNQSLREKLRKAIEGRDVERIREILDRNRNLVDAEDLCGDTALSEPACAEKGSLKMVKLLHEEYGADINKSGYNRWNGMTRAGYHGKTGGLQAYELVKIFIRRGKCSCIWRKNL